MICDSVAIISKGTIIKQGTMDDLLQGHTVLEIHAEDVTNDIISKLEKIDEDVILDETIKCMWKKPGDTRSCFINYCRRWKAL